MAQMAISNGNWLYVLQSGKALPTNKPWGKPIVQPNYVHLYKLTPLKTLPKLSEEERQFKIEQGYTIRKEYRHRLRRSKVLQSRCIYIKGETYHISDHCRERMEERAFSFQDVRFVLEYGKHVRERKGVRKSYYKDIEIIYDIESKLLFTMYRSYYW